ncbi:MAG TPA: hypothetical protein VL485_09975 [Ktedonobacteraceae bacterium]|jgi:threonine dehydrogenase-like Zn-dependent dehydrogenase|nr:hypothetical protein [Ktedonobacteraceae bacterium]
MVPEIHRVIFTEPQHAELLFETIPTTPLGPHEVIGRTLVSLISAGTELAGYQNPAHRFGPSPGYAAVFQVTEVGEQINDLRPGDFAFCMGPHSSYQRMEREKLLPLPADLTPESAVFARMMSVSMSTLTTTTARPPATVLVTGLGQVGYFAARVFALCGYSVLASDPIEARRHLLQGIPGIQTVPEVPLNDPQVVGNVALALECSGHEQAVLDACRIVRKRGEVVMIGLPWQRRTELFAHPLLSEIFHRYVVLRSGWEWELPMHATEFRQNSIWENLDAALHWLSEGRLDTSNLYTVANPQHAGQIYRNLLQSPPEKLATIFDWRD